MPATLKIEKRDGRGKNEARRLRASGRIPAVLYGGKSKTLEIAVDPKSLLRILHSESGVNTLIGLEGVSESGDARVMVKEYQLDPIDHKLLHVDFYQVAMDKAIAVTVPIVLKGEAKGVKQQGGIVDFVNREIEIEVLPGDIPENLTVDVSELMLNQGIRVRDLLTEGIKWKAISEPDTMIVHVVALKVEEEAPAAEAVATGTTPAEPEVIKKGKQEKEEE
jgi:large subunit ribosomal protein L25